MAFDGSGALGTVMMGLGLLALGCGFVPDGGDEGGEETRDCTQTGCAAGESCVEGVCVPMAGTSTGDPSDSTSASATGGPSTSGDVTSATITSATAHGASTTWQRPWTLTRTRSTGCFAH